MSLTPRENLLRLWRREGFEDAPAFFYLCPSLIEEFKRRYGCAQSYQDQFNIPFRGVSTIAKDNKHDWMKYYPGATFNPGTTFDNCGVANEPQPESMHMTRMYHPMKNFTSLDELMMDMMDDDEKAVYHPDKQTELVRSRFVALARAGVDFILLGDDIGMQHSIMK